VLLKHLANAIPDHHMLRAQFQCPFNAAWLPRHPKIQRQLALQQPADHLLPAGYGQKNFGAADADTRQHFGNAKLVGGGEGEIGRFLAVANGEIVQLHRAGWHGDGWVKVVLAGGPIAGQPGRLWISLHRRACYPLLWLQVCTCG
jgi:hypothetical protein